MSDVIGASIIAKVKEEGTATAASNFGKAGEAAHGAAGHIGGFISSIGKIAGVIGIVAGVTMAFGFLKEAVSEGAAANEVAAQTTAVLKSTKGAAGETADSIEKLSTKYMNLTGIQDDTVRSTANMLLTFTNIGSKGGIFDQATKTALDMSVALKQDASSSAIQLGKALNDPLKGITALQRVGVTFDDQQKKQIATYMAHGQIAKAQGVILTELSKEFGGSAEAAGKANGGIKILSAQFDNMKQSIGQAVIPVLVKVGSAILPLITQFGQWLPGAIDTASKFIETHLSPILAKVSDFVKTQLVPALQRIGTWIVQDGIPAIQGLVAWGEQHVVPVFKAIADVVMNNVVPGLQTIWASIQKNLLPELKNLWEQLEPVLIPTLQKLGLMFQRNIAPAIGDVIGAFSTLVGWTGKVLGFIGQVSDAIGLKSAFLAAWNNLGPFIQGVWDTVKGIIQTGVADVVNTLNSLIDAYNKLPGHDHVGHVGDTGTQAGTAKKAGAAGGVGFVPQTPGSVPIGGPPAPHVGNGGHAAGNGYDAAIPTHSTTINVYPAKANFTAQDLEALMRRRALEEAA